jgi:SAM-dependent methyltransferase
MSPANRYEKIGASYAVTRREDPHIKARILSALGAARSVVNVGAGTGSYEPAERRVIAVEPSRVMLEQRPAAAAPALRARADQLPLKDQSVDAALVVLSLHHWDEGQQRGVRELRRVARGPVVIATIDVEVETSMWLFADYLPEVVALDRRIFPPLAQIAQWLGGTTRYEVVEIRRDTPDWTLMSFWAHPERVLDAQARNATSGFARMKPAVVERVVHEVQRDLASGSWDRRHGQLRQLESYDAGLRLLINTPA